jgi:hypothetical protein
MQQANKVTADTPNNSWFFIFRDSSASPLKKKIGLISSFHRPGADFK